MRFKVINADSTVRRLELKLGFVDIKPGEWVFTKFKPIDSCWKIEEVSDMEPKVSEPEPKLKRKRAKLEG